MSETATETAKTQTDAESSQAVTATETATTLLGTETKTEQASTEQTQATETKTEATETKTETKTEAKVEGAPEKYEFADADKYDAGVLGTFSEAAKEANLTQDAAQKFLEKVAPAVQVRTEEQVKAVQQQWIEASKSDKEFGGDKFQENIGIAKKALDTFASPDFRKFLDTSGLGNYPEMIRMMHKIGKAISEDGFVSGSAPSRTAADAAAVLYDKTAGKE